MTRLVDWDEMRGMSAEERERVKRVTCGPECEFCDDEKRGIAVVTQLDYFGDVYPEATGVILYRDEWIVRAIDPDAEFGEVTVATYPKDKVVGIRNIPCETRLYSHMVLEDDPKVTGIVAYDYMKTK